MNILLINHYAGSNIHGMEYRAFFLAREWVKMGHNVTIAAASYSHLRTAQPAGERPITLEDIEGIRYVWLKATSYQGNGVRRVSNMLQFVLRLFQHRRYLFQNCMPDLVIAASTYLLDIFPALQIAKKSGAQLVMEVRDLWPLTPVLLGGMPTWHPVIQALQWVESFAYTRSDFVVSVLPAADNYMKSRGMEAHKFVRIPNGVDIDEWENSDGGLPTLHSEELHRLHQNGRFIVGYAGNHGLSNALDAFVDAAPKLTNLAVTFVLVGQGPEKHRLQTRAIAAGTSNILFLPPVPRTAIPYLLKSMDVCYLGWARSPLYRFGISPNKLLDYMMAGKPIIHATDAPNDLVTASGCGISVPPEDSSAIVLAVDRLIQMSHEERESMGRRGREYVCAHHDYRVLARRFLDAIRAS